MAEEITGEVCHVCDAATARRFVETLRVMYHPQAVTFGLCWTAGVTCVLVEMLGVSFVFEPHAARSMADAFLGTATLFPEGSDTADFHMMVMSLREAADRAERRDATQNPAWARPALR